jgi:anti-sigma regulatory factor (Ser/Thr protein kinase)
VSTPETGIKDSVETARLELPGTPVAPSVARLFVRNLCQEWGAEAVCDVAELLSSELVTNAVVHGRTAVELEAAYDEATVPSQLRIEVYDRSPDEIDRSPRPPAEGAEGGRGLAIVARLACRWGVDPCSPGKRVWFMLANDAPGSDPAGRD